MVNPCGKGPKGGASAGTFIGVRQHIRLSPSDEADISRINPRLQLQKAGAICRGGLHMVTVYLKDRVEPKHIENIEILDLAARRLSCVRGPWVLSGDLKCEPHELMATGFVDLIDGVIHAPQDATCGLQSFRLLCGKSRSEPGCPLGTCHR